MQVHFSGHITAPSPERVSESRLTALMPNERRGIFDYTWEAGLQDDILTVNFTTAIFINEALSIDEESQVVTHEQQHFEDFSGLARNMKESIELALENGHGHEITTRLKWFDYDNCKAKKRRHDEAGVVDDSKCDKPEIDCPV